MARLFLLFTVTTAVEMYLLITIGTWMGPLATVGLILVTGALGAWLAQREGLSVLRELPKALSEGQSPAQGLAEGALVIIGSAFLMTPGILTDITGFAFIVPFSRRRLAPIVVNWFARNFQFKAFTGDDLRGGPTGPGPKPPPGEPRDPKSLPFDHPTH